MDKHSVAKFEVTNVREHCKDDLAETFVTKCLLKVHNYFLLNFKSVSNNAAGRWYYRWVQWPKEEENAIYLWVRKQKVRAVYQHIYNVNPHPETCTV